MVYILTKKDSPLVLFSGSKVKEQLNFEVRLNVKGLECILFYTPFPFFQLHARSEVVRLSATLTNQAFQIHLSSKKI